MKIIRNIWNATTIDTSAPTAPAVTPISVIPPGDTLRKPVATLTGCTRLMIQAIPKEQTISAAELTSA